MLWPLGRAKVSYMALTIEYSFSVALGLKRLDTPSLADLSQITNTTPNALHNYYKTIFVIIAQIQLKISN